MKYFVKQDHSKTTGRVEIELKNIFFPSGLRISVAGLSEIIKTVFFNFHWRSTFQNFFLCFFKQIEIREYA